MQVQADLHVHALGAPLAVVAGIGVELRVGPHLVERSMPGPRRQSPALELRVLAEPLQPLGPTLERELGLAELEPAATFLPLAEKPSYVVPAQRRLGRGQGRLEERHLLEPRRPVPVSLPRVGGFRSGGGSSRLEAARIRLGLERVELLVQQHRHVLVGRDDEQTIGDETPERAKPRLQLPRRLGVHRVLHGKAPHPRLADAHGEGLSLGAAAPVVGLAIDALPGDLVPAPRGGHPDHEPEPVVVELDRHRHAAEPGPQRVADGPAQLLGLAQDRDLARAQVVADNRIGRRGDVQERPDDERHGHQRRAEQSGLEEPTQARAPTAGDLGHRLLLQGRVGGQPDSTRGPSTR